MKQLKELLFEEVQEHKKLRLMLFVPQFSQAKQGKGVDKDVSQEFYIIRIGRTAGIGDDACSLPVRHSRAR